MTYFIIAWIVISVINFFGYVTYYQKQFPRIAEEVFYEDLGFALFMSLFPFAGMLTALMLGKYRHGFRWWK